MSRAAAVLTNVTDAIRERFAKRVRVDSATGCWQWTGLLTAGGYGVLPVRADGRTAHLRAHRLAYAIHIGPLDDTLTIDHLCRVRSCVNPAHLEQVPQRVNILRGEADSAYYARRSRCLRGHLFDEKNTRQTAHGRMCRACGRIRSAESRARLARRLEKLRSVFAKRRRGIAS